MKAILTMLLLVCTAAAAQEFSPAVFSNGAFTNTQLGLTYVPPQGYEPVTCCSWLLEAGDDLILTIQKTPGTNQQAQLELTAHKTNRAHGSCKRWIAEYEQSAHGPAFRVEHGASQLHLAHTVFWRVDIVDIQENNISSTYLCTERQHYSLHWYLTGSTEDRDSLIDSINNMRFTDVRPTKSQQ